MTHLTEEKVKEVCRQEIKSTLEHSFPTPLLREIHHITDVLKAIGDGEIGRGVEKTKEHHVFISTLIKSRDKVGNLVLSLIIFALFGGFLYIIKDFLKGFIR